MAITTKIGDKGKTSILFGRMVSKADPMLDLCGTVDELNAAIGVARASVAAPNMKQELLSLQHILFIMGAEVATHSDDYHKLKKIISKEHVDEIESTIVNLEKYNDINNWFIPGETLSSAQLEQARTIARRLERRLVQLRNENEHLQVFVNRLSDYLWLMAQKEEYYVRGIERKQTEETVKESQRIISF
ncbi:cob(I)yrinic acid a,c-diamide adenosyltransferase [Candidatus Woesearchaeota archaeon]|nr:cob(I)yrinic acid a,c-diamide adenosyltransferase [Candidatus Woesearchaeota archaeon]